MGSPHLERDHRLPHREVARLEHEDTLVLEVLDRVRDLRLRRVHSHALLRFARTLDERIGEVVEALDLILDRRQRRQPVGIVRNRVDAPDHIRPLAGPKPRLRVTQEDAVRRTVLVRLGTQRVQRPVETLALADIVISNLLRDPDLVDPQLVAVHILQVAVVVAGR